MVKCLTWTEFLKETVLLNFLNLKMMRVSKNYKMRYLLVDKSRWLCSHKASTKFDNNIDWNVLMLILFSQSSVLAFKRTHHGWSYGETLWRASVLRTTNRRGLLLWHVLWWKVILLFYLLHYIFHYNFYSCTRVSVFFFGDGENHWEEKMASA